MVRSMVPAGTSFFRTDSRMVRGLKRKKSLRDGFIRKLKEQGTKIIYRANGRFKRLKPIKKVSRALRTRMRSYLALHGPFLARPENQLCLICTVRREHGENIAINCATEIHHHRGRRGRLLCWVPGFRPSCFFCRDWPHENKRKAREWGLLAPAVLYDVFPADGRD